MVILKELQNETRRDNTIFRFVYYELQRFYPPPPPPPVLLPYIKFTIKMLGSTTPYLDLQYMCYIHYT